MVLLVLQVGTEGLGFYVFYVDKSRGGQYGGSQLHPDSREQDARAPPVARALGGRACAGG
ncbi:hypothetical protein SBA4_5570008 [Candidatus Sulfopaludibacter sp. SbA4]|nr:hypothetical protein SBA4_5570008 [Candidatus Sulfopaludibacter sp. SbA4]